MSRLLPSGSVRGPALCRRRPEGLGLRQRLWCLLRLKTTQGVQGGPAKGFGQGNGLGCRGARGHVRSAAVRSGWQRESRRLCSVGDTGVAQLPEGSTCLCRVLEKGAVWHSAGRGARPGPCWPSCLTWGAEEAPSRGPHCASGGAAHAMPRAMGRRDALGGWLVKESRESSGVVLRDWGSRGVVEWPFLSFFFF